MYIYENVRSYNIVTDHKKIKDIEMEEIRKKIVARIDQSCSNEDYSSFDLSDLGFKYSAVEQKNIGYLVYDKYDLLEGNLNFIVTFRSYDGSKPFQILPDKNKFEFKIQDNGEEIFNYSNMFEDAIV